MASTFRPFRRSLGVWPLVACLSLAMCTTAPDPVTPDSTALPVPANATPGPFNGAFETRIDLATSDARRDLSDWGPLDAEVYRLPDGTAFDTVEAFYDAELDGWARALPAARADGRRPIAGWARGDDRRAALLVPGTPEDPWPFLVVLTPR